MKSRNPSLSRGPAAALALASATALALASASVAHAQLAYGVDASGGLFSFNLSDPGAVTSIGNLGFTPAAIDFRPGTSTLYAVGVDAASGQGSLFTVNTGTGAATLVGSGFNAAGLVGAGSTAFDFNPTTLQPDGSIRIRLVDNDGSNYRLHSDTGGIALTDASLNGVAGAVTTGAAYTNSDLAVMAGGGTTALYYIDSANDALLFSSNPNGGVVNIVGQGLGVAIGENIGFDIYSGASADVGYLVDTSCNVATLYSVDLGSGVATALGGVARAFTGGFAIDQLAAIPEPSGFAVLASALGLGLAATRRRRATATEG